MFPQKPFVLSLVVCFTLISTASALAQTQTTGRIAGTVKDQNGALIIGAKVKVIREDTGEAHQTTTNGVGSYSVSSLAPGNYQVTITSRSFAPAHLAITVVITETTTKDAQLGFS